MKRCIACGAKLEETILHLDNMPAIVQNMPDNAAEAREDVIDLDLRKCSQCGLVQFDCEPVYYYRDTIRARGVSKKLHDMHLEQFRSFISDYAFEGCKVWEVGCGAGEILSIMAELPVRVFGTEHSSSLVERARELGLDVECGFVDCDTYYDERGPFDAFLSVNFLEHQPHPAAMVRGMHNNLVDGGVGLVTVPSFEYISANAPYYELMRDHIANYDVGSLSRLFIDNGFQVEDVRRFNGDTLSMVVSKAPQGALADNLQGSFSLLSEQVANFLREAPEESVAVWGASHQGFTMLSTMGLAAPAIRCIIDSAPFKWGKFSPGSGLPIISPQDFQEDRSIRAVLVIAPGFSDEIISELRSLRSDIEAIGTIVDGKLVRV